MEDKFTPRTIYSEGLKPFSRRAWGEGIRVIEGFLGADLPLKRGGKYLGNAFEGIPHWKE
jgi:hypothetical protein